jgi:hypothetical protein
MITSAAPITSDWTRPVGPGWVKYAHRKRPIRPAPARPNATDSHMNSGSGSYITEILEGDHLVFEAQARNGDRITHLRFDGHVADGAIEGEMTVDQCAAMHRKFINVGSGPVH